MTRPDPAFETLLGTLRPTLHRYCARMTGSAIDGEDVLQDALAKAIEAYRDAAPLTNPEGWLFRIAHNAALDALRRRARQVAAIADADPELVVDPVDVVADRARAATGLRQFMRLPPLPRSCVILMDVLGYSLAEIGAVTDASLPAIKAALHRGRARLRALAQEPDDAPAPALDAATHRRWQAYVDRFNARDFDAIRDMLGDDVRLELVNRTRAEGRAAVAKYFGNYASIATWRLALGTVDGQPAIVVHEAGARPYCVLLDWAGQRLAAIRDFRYARYALEGADVTPGG